MAFGFLGNFLKKTPAGVLFGKSGSDIIGGARGEMMDFTKRQEARLSPVQDAFMKQFGKPGANYGAAKTAAEATGAEMFQPGGEVADMVSKARGGVMSKGFGVGGAGRGVNAALRYGTGAVGRAFAQGAVGLETQRGQLMGSYLDRLMGTVGSGYGAGLSGAGQQAEQQSADQGSLLKRMSGGLI